MSTRLKAGGPLVCVARSISTLCSLMGTHLPSDHDSTLVFYCSNVWCRKAPQAARRAEGLGYRDVHVMSAGIKGWA